ncbi:MAG TPA: 16S rRNA (guanine(527)-N(7))-methyltransferase RsmG [Dehalococcoidia bacterium]|nr:16S rRNA (guanine(527)-N(7))-methyltransferase RsmG [Dehalococcoidia bacterium]
MEKLTSGAIKLGFPLSSGQLEQFSIYYRELTTWNKRINLTRITNPQEVPVKHFLDSLTITLAFSRPLPDTGLRVIDVGSGAGLPGIPLKLLLPGIRLVLLEATRKKAAFLEHIRDRLGLENTEIVIGRAETVGHDSRYREAFDLVLSRAVARLPALVELTLPFCAIGGRFIAQKKGAITREIDEAAGAIKSLGGSLREIKRVELEELGDERYLIVIDKVAPTAGTYPRRPGIPVKRPLT